MTRFASVVLVVSLWFGVGLSAQPSGTSPLRVAAEREATRLTSAVTADYPSSTVRPASASVVQTERPSDQAPLPMPGRPSWPARHPVLVGALIGTSAGVVYDRARHTGPLFTTYGVIEGSFVGLIVSAVQNANRRYEGSGTVDIIAIRRVVAAVGLGGNVVVTPRTGLPMTGRVRAVGQSDFAIVPDGDTMSVQFAYGDVNAVRAKGLGSGAKVGLAVGVAFNVLAIVAIASLQASAGR
jgi:hypothetical protein